MNACRSSQTESEASIEFTRIPKADNGGPDSLAIIEGRVAGASPGEQIVLFARSGSGKWWVQPLTEQPFTPVQPDAKWKNSTHLGTEYAALLVKSGYRPPYTTDLLPDKGGSVVAFATVKGDAIPQAASRTLNFSGYEWEIRRAPSDHGGTTNNFDPANAWTDASGWLHLRIAEGSGGWTCAEVILARSLGYGSYRFVVKDVSQLEPAVALGIYTWDEFGADQNHREMDVEISRWGESEGKNAQFVVQPYYVPANVARFVAPAGVLTHSFRWQPGRVSFKTIRGASTDGASSVIAQQVFTSGVPSPGTESVRLNLYVFANPKNPLKHGTEVVIEQFEYLP